MPRAKYGIVGHPNNANLGDDIQVYATKLLLPSFDYWIDREHINEFKSDNGEPVAMITSAWWMWRKWNWPFSPCIIPHFIGFHYADHQKARQPGSPLKYEHLAGEATKYLKAYEPIGCRDMFTTEQLQKLGVNAYFTGCITLTLPEMPRKDMGRYICLVDMPPEVEKKIRKMLEGTGVEVRIYTHTRQRTPDMSWEDREKMIEERLTIYQNAICVVTKKLHCSLPCLAMGVPVLLLKEMDDDIRFRPYYDWFHYCKISEFMKGNCDYDLVNPPANSGKHLETRENLIKSVNDFVAKVEAAGDHAEDLLKYHHDKESYEAWQVKVLEETLEKWSVSLKKNVETLIGYKTQYRALLEERGIYEDVIGMKSLSVRMDTLDDDPENDYRLSLTPRKYLMINDTKHNAFIVGRIHYSDPARMIKLYKSTFDILLDLERTQQDETKIVRKFIKQIKKNKDLPLETVKENLETIARYEGAQKRFTRFRRKRIYLGF